MKLTDAGIKDKEQWEKAGYSMPKYDRAKVIADTMSEPEWIHFGAGNIFRAFQANVVQNLLNKGILTKGLIVAEGYDYEIIDKANKPYDNLSILVTLKASGNVDKIVVGSIVEALKADSLDADFVRLKEIFHAPSLKMVSFTITEKGYSIVNSKGVVMEAVLKDFEAGPECPQSYIGKVVALLYDRFLNNELPIAMVSMDNCSHNGDKLYHVVNVFAREWESRGLVKKGFTEYVQNKEKVSFPWTMIDKITPRPDEAIVEILKKDGIEKIQPVVTAKNTYVAPFVNSEECQYLVIEDSFPNGKISLEEGGIIYTNRETVDKVEKMKVCTCLNPLHTAMAIYGCLLGYTSISTETKDPEIKKMIERIGYTEGLPVVVNPGIIKPENFLKEVIETRLPNPFLPDTPQRISTDTSQKLSIRYGETVKAYMNNADLDIRNLKMIPLVFAGWLRYLKGIDDKGNVFTPSSDPLLEEAASYVKGFTLGSKPKETEVHDIVKKLLSRKDIFGVNLYEAGLGEEVEKYFIEMLVGTDAVRNTLRKYTQRG